MKRYLLFRGECYYPGGGWNDFCESFDSIDDAISAHGSMERGGVDGEWAHVVDTETREVVRRFDERSMARRSYWYDPKSAENK